MPKLLVTGGSGFIGKAVCENLKKKIIKLILLQDEIL